jgi:hypothetical protein
MRTLYRTVLIAFLCGPLSAQTNSFHRSAPRMVFEGRPGTLQLAPHVTTTIRLPEPVNSVVVGDSNLFQAEYSPNEPLLVFARPIVTDNVETNLVISTIQGRQFVLLLRSMGAAADEKALGGDLFVVCQPAGVHFIEESFPSVLIADTVRLRETTNPSAKPDAGDSTPEAESELLLDEMVHRQHFQRIPKFYGDSIRVGIGEVVEHGARMTVSFSVMNPKSVPMESVLPQVQLANLNKGGFFKSRRWTTVQQLPIEAYRLSPRRVGPGGRADGVVVFERPPMKESREQILLQIADSASVDQPILAPIPFRSTKPLEQKHE